MECYEWTYSRNCDWEHEMFATNCSRSEKGAARVAYDGVH